MTRAPGVTSKPTKAFAKPEETFDTTIGRRFINPSFDGETTPSMPQTAERVAQKRSLTREELDTFALRSHQRAVHAMENGRFSEQIVAVPVDGRQLTPDEGPRPETTIEKLATLPPVNGPTGVVTAGNLSSLNDGRPL